MADIQVRQQFPEYAGLSVGRDFSDYDVWARQQFAAAPDLSAHRTIMPLLVVTGSASMGFISMLWLPGGVGFVTAGGGYLIVFGTGNVLIQNGAISA
jgi:hypothetical protein